jgi:hypothetical protein
VGDERGIRRRTATAERGESPSAVRRRERRPMTPKGRLRAKGAQEKARKALSRRRSFFARRSAFARPKHRNHSQRCRGCGTSSATEVDSQRISSCAKHRAGTAAISGAAARARTVRRSTQLKGRMGQVKVILGRMFEARPCRRGGDVSPAARLPAPPGQRSSPAGEGEGGRAPAASSPPGGPTTRISAPRGSLEPSSSARTGRREEGCSPVWPSDRGADRRETSRSTGGRSICRADQGSRRRIVPIRLPRDHRECQLKVTAAE